MSEWSVLRAYLLDTWRGLLLTSLVAIGVAVVVAIALGASGDTGPIVLPLLICAAVAWDYRDFRRKQLSRGRDGDGR